MYVHLSVHLKKQNQISIKIYNMKLTEKEQKKIYLMQSVALTNYAKMCIKLNEVPRLDIIENLANCEDVKKLIESNNIFLAQLKADHL